MQDKIDSVCAYWFEGVTPTSIPKAANQRWFGGGTELDDEIRQRFGSWVELAAAGDFDHWQNSPNGTLALLILLDQFPLNIYRGTARAYAYEQKALNYCHAGLKNQQDQSLNYAERIFFYMPLEHSEDIADQQRAVELFGSLLESAPAGLREHAQGTLDYAIRHRDIIQQFGRFPHRNAVLGREQTPEESEFLEDRSNRFGQ